MYRTRERGGHTDSAFSDTSSEKSTVVIESMVKDRIEVGKGVHIETLTYGLRYRYAVCLHPYPLHDWYMHKLTRVATWLLRDVLLITINQHSIINTCVRALNCRSFLKPFF